MAAAAPNRIAIALVALAASFGSPGVVAAQQTPTARAPDAPRGCAPAAPDSTQVDVLIRASAHIDRLTFTSPPDARVTVDGCDEGDRWRVVERRNLPDPVVVGETYRDVYVAAEFRARVDVRCLLAPADAAEPAGGCALNPAADTTAAPKNRQNPQRR